MLNKIIIALILLFCAGTLRAQSFPSKIVHYVSTHKELLAADSIILAAGIADTWSSDGCQHYRKYCIETNPLLGQHPTQFDTAAYGMGLSALLVAAQHGIWHFAPDKGARHVIWFIATPQAVAQSMNSWNNVQGTQGIRACYRSGICN